MIALIDRPLPELYKHAQGLLDAADPRDCLLLGVLRNAATNPPASALGWEVWDQGVLLGLCVCTKPFPMLLSDMPADALDVVADAIATRGLLPLAINGLGRVTQHVRDRLVDRHRAHGERGETLRLFELRHVIAVHGVAGHMRLAEVRDALLVEHMFVSFEREAQPVDRHMSQPGKFVQRLLAARTAFLWEVGGQPVCLAVKGRDVGVGASIGPVYTPVQQRGRGYASALVAALSQRLLDEGKTYTCLFTDLANPVSNRIYPKLGYVPLEDFQDWNLTIARSF